MSAYVLRFGDAGASQPSVAGGKGAALSSMYEKKILIPPAFIITTEAFQTFAGKAIQEKALPDELRERVFSTFDAVYGAEIKVAVRSSAVVEDGRDLSYAGQFITELSVSRADLEEAILKVWRSGMDMETNYLTGEKIKNNMAVLVQEMLKATQSGVAFSRYPDIDANNMKIELVDGNPDQLVAGNVNPQTYLLSRAIPDFSDKSLRKLYNWVIDMEAIFGEPCDIEWGIVDDDIYLLQVRPITISRRRTIPQKGASSSFAASPHQVHGFTFFYGEVKPYDLWTRGNVGEVLPDTMTPLSWSIWGEHLSDLLRKSMMDFSFAREVQTTCFTKLDRGKLYYNIGAINYFAHTLLGLPAMDFVVGGEHMHDTQNYGFDIQWRKVLKNSVGLMKSNKQYKNLSQISQACYKEIDAFLEEECALDLRSADEAALFAQMDKLADFAVDKMFLHTDSTAASFTYSNVLCYLLDKWTNNEVLMVDLISNIKEIEIVDINTYIQDIALRVNKAGCAEGFCNALQSANWEEELTKKGLAAYVSSIQQIFDHFGHRGNAELEFSNLTWGQDKSQIFDIIIKTVLNCEAEKIKDADTVCHGHENRYNKVLDEAYARMRYNVVKKSIFNYVLKETRKFISLRENNKHRMYRIIYQMKQVIHAMKYRLSLRPDAKKLLGQDFYYLTFDEVKSIFLQGRDIDHKLIQDIAWRKKLFTPAEDTESSDHEPHNKRNLLHQPMDNKLWGLIASSGMSRGRARVLSSFQDISQVELGDILVVKTIDIGWTPVFSKISALVTEIGGTLSHAAIIAREFSLPTIVNVKDLMSSVQNGCYLVVDANEGSIQIHQEKEVS